MTGSSRPTVTSTGSRTIFAWTSGNGNRVHIPASELPLPFGKDQIVDGANWPTVPIGASGKVNMDRAQNVWVVPDGGVARVVRVRVDGKGAMTAPDTASPPKQGRCPAGDRCDYKDAPGTNPGPSGECDITGFGYRSFTRPDGRWALLHEGCGGGPARWLAATVVADVPPGARVLARFRGEDVIRTGADPSHFVPVVTEVPDSVRLRIDVALWRGHREAPRIKGVRLRYQCL